MQNGWVKIHRKIVNKGWYKHSEYVHLWFHLIMKATHTDKEFFSKGRTVVLNPGQFVTGRDALSQETGIHSSKIERILKTFETEQQIEQQKSNVGRLISIVSWCKYQISEQQIEQPMNNERTTDEQRMNTIKKDKNDKNVKKNTILSFGNDEPSYNEFLKTLDTSDTKELYTKLKEFIYEKKPKQPEPYVDFWNLYADKYNLSKVKIITDLRKSKLKTRITEPTFDLPEIMLKISKDDFLKGGKGGWQVTFDHVIESQNNYAKILERK